MVLEAGSPRSSCGRGPVLPRAVGRIWGGLSPLLVVSRVWEVPWLEKHPFSVFVLGTCSLCLGLSGFPSLWGVQSCGVRAHPSDPSLTLSRMRTQVPNMVTVSGPGTTSASLGRGHIQPFMVPSMTCRLRGRGRRRGHAQGVSWAPWLGDSRTEDAHPAGAGPCSLLRGRQSGVWHLEKGLRGRGRGRGLDPVRGVNCPGAAMSAVFSGKGALPSSAVSQLGDT